MNVLAVCGSPRGTKSQTRALVDAVLAKARVKGAETEFIDLAKVRIGFCQACEQCHQGPDCVLNDDGRDILGRMLLADGIVLASPVYLDHVTALLKSLLDRTSHFVHCMRLSGKYVAAVTTSGGGGGEGAVAFLKRYAMTVGAQFVGHVDAAVPLRDADYDAADALGASLYDAIARQTAWPDQLRAIDEQRRRFGRLIEHHQNRWPYEHAYWQSKGWI